jgi:nucleoside-diphosphate-sugar epimerase
MDILMTGTYGRCGTAVLDSLHGREEYSFTNYNRSDRPDEHPYGGYDTIVGNVTDFESLFAATDERDAVIHLAAYPYTDGEWTDVQAPNICGMYNALETARQNEVDTFVFGSTNHVMGMYERETTPELYYGDHGMALDHSDPIRPDSYYGTTKAFGEALCRQYAELYDFPKHIYVIRICSVRMPKYDHPYGDAEAGVDDGRFDRDSSEYDQKVARMKGMWQSRRDFAHEIDCCLRDESISFDIFNGVSDNARRWFSIEHARSTIGYRPEDDAEEWNAPPD